MRFRILTFICILMLCTCAAAETVIDGTAEIGDYAYERSSITSAIIKNSVKRIGEGAFYYCTDLKSVSLPEGLSEIGDYAFDHCLQLEEINIPSSVKRIGESAFSYNQSLEALTISEGVEEIGAYAFSYCVSLKSITLPSTIKSVDEGAFMGMRNLEYLYVPAGAVFSGKNMFENCPKLKIQYSSGTNVTSYIKASNISYEEINSLTIEKAEITQVKFTGKSTDALSVDCAPYLGIRYFPNIDAVKSAVGTGRLSETALNVLKTISSKLFVSSKAGEQSQIGTISSLWGEYYVHSNGNRGNKEFDGIHEGVDVYASSGAYVHSLTDGIVKLKYGDAYGTIVIENDGYYITYMHCKNSFVNEGEYVSKGDLIGQQGKVGTGGEHVHIEIKKSFSGKYYTNSDDTLNSYTGMGEQDFYTVLSILMGDETRLSATDRSGEATRLIGKDITSISSKVGQVSFANRTGAQITTLDLANISKHGLVLNWSAENAVNYRCKAILLSHTPTGEDNESDTALETLAKKSGDDLTSLIIPKSMLTNEHYIKVAVGAYGADGSETWEWLGFYIIDSANAIPRIIGAPIVSPESGTDGDTYTVKALTPAGTKSVAISYLDGNSIKNAKEFTESTADSIDKTVADGKCWEWTLSYTFQSTGAEESGYMRDTYLRTSFDGTKWSEAAKTNHFIVKPVNHNKFDESTYQLTGNMANDLVGIAKTQIGYQGSNKENDLLGILKDGEKNGDWQKYSSETGLIQNDAWCATFVSWCASKAGIGESIIPHSAGAGTYRRIGTPHKIWGDNFDQPIQKGITYTPKAGDLAVFMPRDDNNKLYNSYDLSSHVAIVEQACWKNDMLYVTIIHGNTKDNIVKRAEFKVNTKEYGSDAYWFQLFVTPDYPADTPAITPTPPNSTLPSQTDSYEYSDYTDITLEQIDAFIKHYGSSILNNTTSLYSTYSEQYGVPGTTSLKDAFAGCTVEQVQTMTPAEIIFRVCKSQDCNVVYILATLQKEQGLMTATTGLTGRIKWATGYGIYDPNKETKYAGFIQQVYWCARQQKIYETAGYSVAEAYGKYSPTSDGNASFSHFYSTYYKPYAAKMDSIISR